jgi:hypothetical protein
MQIKVPPTSQTKLMDAREHRLTAFVTASIEATVADGQKATVLAVIRSPESPVARALIALRPLLAAHGATVRMVFADDDTSLDQFAAANTGADAVATEVRIIRNPRLRDAHEQLIVARQSVWFGDSLRRDGTRRDLFEQFHRATPEIARSAARTFENLWSLTEPYLPLPALAQDSLTALPRRSSGNTGPAGAALC